MCNTDDWKELEDIPKDTLVYFVNKNVMFLQIDIHVIASSLSYKDTVDWYCKEYEVEKEDLEIKPVDIKIEGLWIEVDEEDDEYDTLCYLGYINDFVELIRGNRNDKFNNLRYIDGELCKYISYKEYYEKYLSFKTLLEPEIIASTEY